MIADFATHESYTVRVFGNEWFSQFCGELSDNMDYMSQPFAPKFAPSALLWLSVSSRLALGQLHKSLFDNH